MIGETKYRGEICEHKSNLWGTPNLDLYWQISVATPAQMKNSTKCHLHSGTQNMHLHVPFSQLTCQHTVANSVSPLFTAVEWFWVYLHLGTIFWPDPFEFTPKSKIMWKYSIMSVKWNLPLLISIIPSANLHLSSPPRPLLFFLYHILHHLCFYSNQRVFPIAW